jgi:dihydrofolate reductase
MNLVVAVDRNWGIGYKGDLLARIKADLKNFAVLTRERAVVLGSNTLATFPGGRVLKGRKNIVLNPDPDYAPEGACVAHSIEEAVKKAEEYGSENVWVIGGMSIYRQMLPYCDKAFVTRIDADFKKDAYFPDLDSDSRWKLIFEGAKRESESGDILGELNDGTVPEKVEYRFTVYAAEKGR